MLAIVRAAFAARPPVDPPADALAETEESLAAALRERRPGRRRSDGRDVGALVLDPEGSTLWLRRVGVLPEVREHGVATALVAEALARAAGVRRRRGAGARGAARHRSRSGASTASCETGRHSPYVELRRPAPRGLRRPRRRTRCARSGASLASVLRAGRRRRAVRRARCRQDDVHPGARRRAGRARRRHLADVRDRAGAPVARRTGRRWCTSTPTASAGSPSSTTSTSTPPSTRRSRWSSGGGDRRGAGRRPARGAHRAGRRRRGAPVTASLDPRRVRVSPVGRRWLGVRLPALDALSRPSASRARVAACS